MPRHDDRRHRGHAHRIAAPIAQELQLGRRPAKVAPAGSLVSIPSPFRDTFKVGDAVFKVKKDGGDIDAISGATVSCRAVARAVELASAFYREHRDRIAEAVKE